MSAGHILARLSVALLLCGACGGEQTEGPAPAPQADVASDAASEPDQETEPRGYPKGQIMGEAGACTAVGIQTCADLFVDPVDGLCKPSTSRCDPGEIPVFAQGCVAV